MEPNIPSTSKQTPAPKESRNVIAAVYGVISTFTLAALQLLTTWLPQTEATINLIIPISPAISTLITAICLHFLKETVTDRAQARLFRKVENRYHLRAVALQKDIKELEVELKDLSGEREKKIEALIAELYDKLDNLPLEKYEEMKELNFHSPMPTEAEDFTDEEP